MVTTPNETSRKQQSTAALKRAPSRTVARERLSDAVAASIKAYIMEKQLRAGDRLPTEQTLADMFGVSRISVREATKALAFIGIIEAAPKRGLTVGRIDMQRVTDYLGFHFALNDYPKEQLLKTRLILETGALGEAMPRIAADDALFNHLIAMTEQHAQVRDLDEYIRHDVAFHHALLAASGIEPLLAFNDLLAVFFSRFRTSVLKLRHTWPLGVQGHRYIVLALRAGHLTKATALLREHLSAYQPDL